MNAPALRIESVDRVTGRAGVTVRSGATVAVVCPATVLNDAFAVSKTLGLPVIDLYE